MEVIALFGRFFAKIICPVRECFSGCESSIGARIWAEDENIHLLFAKDCSLKDAEHAKAPVALRVTTQAG